MTTARPSGDEVRATVGVTVTPAVAFRIFTQEIDLWWRRGQRFRSLPGERGIVCIEPGVGGRLFESVRTDDGERVVEIGRTLVWQPPRRLVLEWRSTTFAPHERTEVEVLFADGPGGGTQVTVIHRGWASIRPDHPVRHGQPVPAFLRMMGMWWGDQLTTLRLRAAGVPMAAPTRPPAP